jgi:hypothetical protein
MRGGDHHARDGALVLDSERDGRRGRVRLGKQHREAIGSENARYLAGITIGEKARVETHYDLAGVGPRAAVPGFVPMVGSYGIADGLCKNAEIIKREAVRTEVNGHILFLEFP